MSDHSAPSAGRPALLCFDGSANATEALSVAGTLLGGGPAVVLMVWAPVVWEPYDPATIVTAPLVSSAARTVDLEGIEEEVALDVMRAGVKLAGSAGFAVHGRAEQGKAWRVICDVALQIDAAVIVMGARGHLHIGPLGLGSVSSAVLHHAHCPVLVVPALRG